MPDDNCHRKGGFEETKAKDSPEKDRYHQELKRIVVDIYNNGHKTEKNQHKHTLACLSEPPLDVISLFQERKRGAIRMVPVASPSHQVNQAELVEAPVAYQDK